MKKVFYLIMFSFVFIPVLNAQTLFEKSYSNGNVALTAYPGTNQVYVTQDIDDNYYLAGTTNTNTTQQNSEFFLMKLNPFGDTLWTRTYGASGNLEEVLLSADMLPNNNGFILAGFSQSFSFGAIDAFLVRLDINGNLLWSKNYGGSNADAISCIKYTIDKGFIGCGWTSTSSMGTQDAYLIKLDSLGNIQWQKNLGGSASDHAAYVEQTPDKGFIVTGSTKSFSANTDRIYLIKTDSLGSPSWSKIYGGTVGEAALCVKNCAGGGYILTGYTNSYGAGAQDAFLLRADALGNMQWLKTYGGVWEDIGYYVEQTNDNGFILSGRTQSFGPNIGTRRNVYLVKTNTTGDTLWTRVYGSIIGNAYMAKRSRDKGYIIASSPNNKNFNLIKTDTLGNGFCNKYSSATISGTVSTNLLTGANVVTSGSVSVAAPLKKYTPAVTTTSCLSVGIPKIAENLSGVRIYPNPFNDFVNIDTNELTKIELYNIMGEKIFERSISESNSKIDMHQYPKGMYLLKLERGETLKVFKLLKE